MTRRLNIYTGLILAVALFLASCSEVLEWPASPLYDFVSAYPLAETEVSADAVKQQLVGHYAHYDVVAYEDTTTKTPMRTFIISYGFTDFYMKDGKLMESNSYMFAEQKLSRKGAYSWISDEAVQAISPPDFEVEVYMQDGVWYIYRAPSPSLLGIEGDPLLPLLSNPDNPNFTDPDGDGHPGVTVHIGVEKLMEGEIYITRREIFSYYAQLHANGMLSGYVIDESEQFVVGASKKILNQPSNSVQIPDKGLSPLLLVPIDPEIDTKEELMEIRDKIFPEEPVFYVEQ